VENGFQVLLRICVDGTPKIKAAVIAIADEKWIEKPLATIVLVNKEILFQMRLTEFYRDFVKYQIRKTMFISMTKTSVGK
jgi:fatty-acyl-CoA synthase